MEICRHEDVEKDFKHLRRFPAPQKSLEAWERLFCSKGLNETPGIDPFPGFGDRKIYKGRVMPLRKNIGKSKGYRVVFEMCDDGSCKIAVFSRHGIYRSENELIKLAKVRLGI